jgi:hypothetical protein
MTRFHLGVFWLAHANGDPCLLAEEAVRRWEVLRWWRVQRGSYLPQFLVFMLILVMTYYRFGLEGSFLPPCPHGRPGGSPSPPPLPPCPQPFIVGMVGLLPHRILGQGDPPQGTTRVPKILRKNAYVL